MVGNIRELDSLWMKLHLVEKRWKRKMMIFRKERECHEQWNIDKDDLCE
jgi:hypothetical protein